MRIVAMGLVAALALTGCTGSSTDKSAPEPSASASSSLTAPNPALSPSPSPTAFESFPPAPVDEAKDQAAIRAAWVKYVEVFEKFSKNPEKYSDLSEAHEVATGEEANVIVDAISRLRAKKWRAGGGVKFVNVVVGKPQVTGGYRTATVTYCIDNTEQVVYGADGQQIKREPVHYKETATLVEEEDLVWRVSMVRNTRTNSC